MAKVDLSKTFEHRDVDPKWYAFWESIGAFRADPDSGRPPFSMVLPPPNVTGWLHIGHAFNQTLPDIVARWRRMRGDDVLWLPGTDHAGIATQNVVERHLADEGKTRHDLGRDAFEARVWDWARQSKGTIIGQMRTLGSSVDWSRERFTLDEDLSRAVRKAFVTLYDEGLIHRGNYIVNWCPRCRTALSDLEVVHRETNGSLYYVRYPFADGHGSGSIMVATTRPETMLGDTAVAVHPDDERYRDAVGRRLRLPILGRELPVIADAFVATEFGTGAVKVTPAHDPNDFAMGQRHDLPQESVIDEDGRMTEAAGPFAGLDRRKARAAVVEQLERDGALDHTEAHRHAVGHCQRCGTVVEPLVSTQWFVRIAPLAEPAVDAVRSGRITFVPENWEKTYFEWMTNIHDWCISRQLWWGHRIPAWYCDTCDRTIVAETTPEQCPCGGALRQETDVLDTWFSSGLWPFSTMGWPESTADLERYYPTSVMITALDIIFFWVARMIMLGLKFGQEVPFRKVYITSLVRDAHGKKMSKSKGNVVNPLELMDEIGADALRFTLTALASPGMDIALSEGRLRGYRQFVNKIWNASRFVLMQIGEIETRPEPPARPAALAHRWILHRVSALGAEVNAALDAFRFDVAADRLYHFFWHEYADWYIELVKPYLQSEGPDRDTAVAVLLEVHDRTLRLLHPIIPFVTEEVWQQLPRRPADGRTADGEHQTLTLAAFPMGESAWLDEAAAAEMAALQEVITAIRTVRSEWGVAPARKLVAFVEGADAGTRATLEGNRDHLTRLAGLERLEFEAHVARDPETVVRVVRGLQVHLPLAGIVDRQAELQRIEKELAKIGKQQAADEAKLGNPKFRERAAPDVVAETETRLQGVTEQRQKLERLLQELSR
ncbi:MAG TPA: valine--tRNA ligase [Acidobacteria bacterium]|jgi:valyl-tRNA synthetase|nr:valine--tRNA ligase [Vicinamibacterales bacterium]HAK54517.1 valine--tRNA ligase [Acidobacteriota bacterium]|tara:strand:- start:491 stop:3163 length:2673 start_codon:yes stop_codon:yes gene_type:complete